MKVRKEELNKVLRGPYRIRSHPKRAQGNNLMHIIFYGQRCRLGVLNSITACGDNGYLLEKNSLGYRAIEFINNSKEVGGLKRKIMFIKNVMKEEELKIDKLVNILSSDDGGMFDKVKDFLDAGGNPFVDIKIGGIKTSPFKVACVRGFTEIVKEMLNNKNLREYDLAEALRGPYEVEVNGEVCDKNTLMHCIFYEGNNKEDIVKLLLKHGASKFIFKRNSLGCTALECAKDIFKDDSAVIKSLNKVMKKEEKKIQELIDIINNDDIGDRARGDKLEAFLAEKRNPFSEIETEDGRMSPFKVVCEKKRINMVREMVQYVGNEREELTEEALGAKNMEYIRSKGLGIDDPGGL